jgi:hypothetical protein
MAALAGRVWRLERGPLAPVGGVPPQEMRAGAPALNTSTTVVDQDRTCIPLLVRVDGIDRPRPETWRRRTSACGATTSALCASSTAGSGAGVWAGGWCGLTPVTAWWADERVCGRGPSHTVQDGGCLAAKASRLQLPAGSKAQAVQCASRPLPPSRGRVAELVGAGEVLKGERDALLKLIQVGLRLRGRHITERGSKGLTHTLQAGGVPCCQVGPPAKYVESPPATQEAHTACR